MDNYRIYHRDKSKFYDVPYRSYNAETPIIMNGKNSSNYGKDLNQNLLNLLSNFSNDTPDARSVEGQLWYDSNNKVLKLKDNTGFQKIGYVRPPIVPNDALKDYDLNMEMMNYLSIDGGTLSGTLLLKDVEENDNENSAVTKNYVDGKKPPMPLGYIPLTGNNTIAIGKIYLPNKLPTQDLQAAPKLYADTVIPQMVNLENATISDKNDLSHLKGYANIIEHHPFNLIYIFGESYIPADNITTNIGFGKYGNLKSYQLQISIIKNINPDITVDGLFKVSNVGEGSLTIIRHNTKTPEAITVHYIITGIKA